MKLLTSPILAAVIAAPLALPVWAEQHTSGNDDASMSHSESAAMESGADTAAGSDMASQSMGDDANAVVVSVGDTDITAGDVQTAIQGFPPQLIQSQPAERLIPLALDQLILRELILQRANEDNLGEDPEVQSIMEENAERSRDDAIVQVYVQRQMEGSVTDEAVQAAYDEVASNTEQELPPIDAVRPQIEQQLRQERLGQVREDLMGQEIEIVYYDADGNPVEASAEMGGQSGSTDSSDDSDSSDMDSGSDADSSETEDTESDAEED